MNKVLVEAPERLEPERARTTICRAIRWCTTMVVAMGVVLGFGLQQASAALITTSHPFRLKAFAPAPDVTDIETVSLPLDQFDPTLGTLTGMTIEFDTWTFWVRGVIQASCSPATTLTAFNRAQAFIQAALFEPNLVLGSGRVEDRALCSDSNLGGPLPSDLTCYDEFGPTSPDVLPSKSITMTDPATLALFVGTGTLLSDYQLWLYNQSGAYSDGVFPAALIVDSRAYWQGETRITYEYRPAGVPVPEPSALLLMGLALAGLWFMRKSKQV